VLKNRERCEDYADHPADVLRCESAVVPDDISGYPMDVVASEKVMLRCNGCWEAN
jgi:hypothetical protein